MEGEEAGRVTTSCASEGAWAYVTIHGGKGTFIRVFIRVDRRVRVREDVTIEGTARFRETLGDATMLALQMEEGAASQGEQVEKTKEQVLAWSLQKDQPCPHLDFSPMRPKRKSGLQNSKTLLLWSLQQKKTNVDGKRSLVSESPGVAITNCHRRESLKQQKQILSQFWRPEVSNPGVSRDGSFQRLGERICSTPLPQHLLAPGNPWCSLACKCIIPISVSAGLLGH